MKRTTFLFALLSIIFAACENPDSILPPTHATRVPRPILSAPVSDTTPSGTYRLTLHWSVADSSNLKDFEIYRFLGGAGRNWEMLTIMRTFAFGDTTVWGAQWAGALSSDSVLVVKYALTPIGLDRYRGQSSDTVSWTLDRRKH